MSDVFYVKQNDTGPVITTTLQTPDPNNVGAYLPLDLTNVDSVTFRMVGPTTIETAATPLAPLVDGRVMYEWVAGDTEQWGGYAVEWVVDQAGFIQTYPSDGWNWVEVVPSATTDIGGVCNVADVRRHVGREMTGPEQVASVQLIRSLTALLERRLNRPLAVTEFAGERHRIGSLGLLRLHHGPVVAVSEILQDDVVWTGDLDSWDIEEWPYQSVLKVTYTAGTVADAGIIDLCSQVVARTILAPATVSAGTIKSYSVEGTSITYGDVANGGQGGVGRLTVGDLGALVRLRRPVLLT